MKFVYPTWKIKGSPTPNQTLWCCDGCGYCEWGIYNHLGQNVPICCVCKGKKGGYARLRRATEKEKAEALKCLKTIIG